MNPKESDNLEDKGEADCISDTRFSMAADAFGMKSTMPRNRNDSDVERRCIV